MQLRSMRRATTAAATILILSSIAAYADTIPADGDAVTPGNQAIVALPDAAPGQVVTVPVTFRLTCSGSNHAAPGATIAIELLSVTVPGDGAASAASTDIGPVPDDWTAGGVGCPSPAPVLPSNGPSTVSLTMPTTPGAAQEFSLMWSRTGSTGLTGGSAITFRVNVVGNSPPVLHLPADPTAQATSPAGATVTWAATATDAEDAVAPTPTCAPTSGSTFPLGLTTVHCTVTDGGGLVVDGSFVVTVDDTIGPRIVGLPADQHLTTSDPSGTTLRYTVPTTTDAADPDPRIGCLPASGSHIGVGTTTVTCTATDATGNATRAGFTVEVAYVADVAWSAIWGEPVAASGTFTANPGRTVPIKVEILADGVRQARGSAVLTLTTCAGAALGSLPLTWGGGRWNASLDTSMLGGPGCYAATASLDGNAAGTVRIDLRGAAVSAAGDAKGKPKK